MAIRIATEQDLPRILEIYAPYIEKTAYSFEYTVPTLEDFTLRFQTVTQQFPWLVWTENGRIMGYAYGSAPFERAAFGWCAEASIYLDPEAFGKGVGRKLYAALEAILSAQGYQKVYVLITTENTASLAFHQAVGYTYTATLPGCGWKFDRLHGIVWMEKQLNSVEIPSAAPIPADSVVKNDRKIGNILDKITLS